MEGNKGGVEGREGKGREGKGRGGGGDYLLCLGVFLNGRGKDLRG
jgi:hypothetical protein